MQVEVVEYDQTWRALYEAEAIKITDSLGSIAAAIHHIGSTAVPDSCIQVRIDGV